MKRNPTRKDPAVLIMAGGMGTRFWPASRERLPKQFLPICGPKPMVEESFDRAASLTDPQRIFVIINAHHRSTARKILGDRGARLVEEPCGRNTAPCIGLGCIHVIRRFGDLPTIALPADHFISGRTEFLRCLQQGVSLLDKGGLVTIGITPTYPETGYGYIEKGVSLSDGEAYRVDRFVEKPNLERAGEFLASGRYLWNSGIFIFKPSTMLKEIALHLPRLGEGLGRISESLGTERYPEILEEVYGGIEPISIDYGVMERTKEPVYVVEGRFGWSDVGSWAAVRKLREAEKDAEGNIASGKVLFLDTTNTFVHSQTERLIAVLGLDDLLVVDTEDVLLLADIKRSQEVRRFSEMVRRKGRTEYV
ncbi:MAG: mannose-1-phosphate guanylyltransferase [Deltaproteobacteria bacterium]|nr:mannose-1-phosphate guanylyltransferase [Deltaproteobacteria bacterium]